MKPSEYNYMIPFGDNILFVNGVSEAIFRGIKAECGEVQDDNGES